MRDIDKIIAILKIEFPACQITQLQTAHPADDNDLWFLKIPDKTREIQIEAMNGNCPFLIELNDDDKRFKAETVDDVIARIRILYS